MKKELLTLSFLAAMTLTGCSNSKPAETSSSPERVTTIEAGTLKVGIEMNYAPMEYKEKGEAAGFDIELAEAIADELGLTVSFEETEFSQIFKGLNEGSYDIIISAVSYNSDRADFYSLTDGYLENRPVIICKEESGITKAEELTDKSVASAEGTTAAQLMADYETASIIAKSQEYSTADEALAALADGSADAVCVDSVIADYFMMDAEENYLTIWEADEAEPFCMCLKDTDETLTAAVKAAYNDLKKKGTLAKISEEYFGKDLTLSMN